MVTPKELSDLLHGVNVAAIAKAANVSTKTVYRLRHQDHSPNMQTVHRLLAAIEAANPATPTRKSIKAIKSAASMPESCADQPPTATLTAYRDSLSERTL